MEEAVGRFGQPPPEMTGPGALAALRVCAPGGYESDAQGTRAVYDSSPVSLPAEGTVPTPLEVLWGDGGREFVVEFCDAQVSPSSRVEAQLERLGLPCCYTDPVVQKPRHWPKFLRRLHACGVVEFPLQAPREQAGVFFEEEERRSEDGDRLQKIELSFRAACKCATLQRIGVEPDRARAERRVVLCSV